MKTILKVRRNNMSKRTPKEDLKSFSWIYIILAVLYAAGVIICFVMPELADKLKEGLGDDWMLKMGIAGGVTALLNIWYFWLARRVAAGKSNGTFFMILLLLGIIGSIVTFFTTKTTATGLLSLDSIADICGLYFLCKARK